MASKYVVIIRCSTWNVVELHCDIVHDNMILDIFNKLDELCFNFFDIWFAYYYAFEPYQHFQSRGLLYHFPRGDCFMPRNKQGGGVLIFTTIFLPYSVYVSRSSVFPILRFFLPISSISGQADCGGSIIVNSFFFQNAEPVLRLQARSSWCSYSGELS